MSKDLGEALRSLRKNCELTQQQIADVLHIDRSTYAYYERGTTEPDLKTIRKLSAMFNVDPSYLLPDDDGKPSVKISDIKGEANRAKRAKEAEMLDLKEPSIYSLSKEEQRLLIWYRALSSEQKEQIVSNVDASQDTD